MEKKPHSLIFMSLKILILLIRDWMILENIYPHSFRGWQHEIKAESPDFKEKYSVKNEIAQLRYI